MKVYLVWYRDTFSHSTHMWGIFATEEKAAKEKETAETLGYIAWINEEEVQ